VNVLAHMKSYRDQFRELTGTKVPHPYQERVADALFSRRNVLLKAPTGFGKTLSVLVPFVSQPERIGARRLIYCLPLRTLAEGIYEEAVRLVTKAHVNLVVTMQTGANGGDPFFSIGDIIVTTYDQLLSGMLCEPYSLSSSLRNINAACAFGNLVVFDEFHLMQPNEAFLTAVALLKFSGGVIRSVWMSATATAPLSDLLIRELEAVEVIPSAEEQMSLFEGRRIQRKLVLESGDLTADQVLKYGYGRTLVVLNSVARAQQLYTAVETLMQSKELSIPLVLLHARFFDSDRHRKYRLLSHWFGEAGSDSAIAIATQVVEAGLNLSGENLLTELCPMNSLMQRAGRCARFEGEVGIVRVFPLKSDQSSPYNGDDLERTRKVLYPTDSLTPTLTAQWVDEVHSEEDARLIEKAIARRSAECHHAICERLENRPKTGISHLIRKGSDSIRVVVLENPVGVSPRSVESVSIWRPILLRSLHSVLREGMLWIYDPDCDSLWREPSTLEELNLAYYACLAPSIAGYSSDLGLRVGSEGNQVSPKSNPIPRPGYTPLGAERWKDHALNVEKFTKERLKDDVLSGGLVDQFFDIQQLEYGAQLLAFLHDLGKLQVDWQLWAKRYQQSKTGFHSQADLLAHTDYDPNDLGDRKLSRSIHPQKPPHAAASAYYAKQVMPTNLKVEVKFSIVAAILGHHGGWWNESTVVQELRCEVPDVIKELGFYNQIETLNKIKLARFKQYYLDSGLSYHYWCNVWPWLAYFIRLLRLSDQKATEEGSNCG
jgi:CRISPR-associated endonuclease/helicase Cas3